jgi:hypothetical protein
LAIYVFSLMSDFFQLQTHIFREDLSDTVVTYIKSLVLKKLILDKPNRDSLSLCSKNRVDFMDYSLFYEGLLINLGNIVNSLVRCQ